MDLTSRKLASTGVTGGILIYLLALFASRSIVLLILPLLLSLLVILGYAVKSLYKKWAKTESDYQDSIPKFQDFNSDPDSREVEEANVHQVTTV